MNTIPKQFQDQFPEIYPETVSNSAYASYSVLNHFGDYCAQHFQEEKTREILHTINKVYESQSLFTCNAIENEFFAVLANRMGANDLMNQLQYIPENLWSVYIKVLIETLKNNHL